MSGNYEQSKMIYMNKTSQRNPIISYMGMKINLKVRGRLSNNKTVRACDSCPSSNSGQRLCSTNQRLAACAVSGERLEVPLSSTERSIDSYSKTGVLVNLQEVVW